MMVWLRFVCACASGQPSSGTGWYDARFFVGPTLGVLQVMPKGGRGRGRGKEEGKQQQIYYGYSKHAPLITGRTVHQILYKEYIGYVRSIHKCCNKSCKCTSHMTYLPPLELH